MATRSRRRSAKGTTRSAGRSNSSRSGSKAAVKTNAKSTKKAAVKANGRGAAAEAARHPLTTLRQEIDRLFEDLTSSFPALPFGRRGLEVEPFIRRSTASFFVTLPAIDVVEKPKEFRLTAELPGLDEKDVELTVTDDVLTIKGEKKDERTEKKKDYYLSERRYGSFQRSFKLPDGVTSDRIEARFHKGILTISLPKSTEVKKRERRISVRRGA